MNLVKKFFINLTLILIGFFIYFLQADFFSWFTISGIKPNLFVIYILFIGLFGNRSMGIIYGAVCGICLDLLYEANVGINITGLVLIGILAILFNKNFSKDSRITIMLMMAALTIFYEVFSYVASYVIFSTNFELLYFIKILLVEVAYNVVLTVILYPAMQKFGYYIENTYTGNKILTRYF